MTQEELREMLPGHPDLDMALTAVARWIDPVRGARLAKLANELETTRPLKDRLVLAERISAEFPEVNARSLHLMARYGTDIPGMVRTRLLFDLGSAGCEAYVRTERERLSRPPSSDVTSGLR